MEIELFTITKATRTGSVGRLFLALGLVAAIGTGVARNVAAAENKPPYIDAYASFEIQNDWTYKSDDPGNELNDLYATVEPTLEVHFTDGLSLTAHGVLEPVRDPEPGDDRYFGDEGFYIQDLFLSYAWRDIAVKGGKFTPNFGRAWDIAPGIYGSDFTEDYELSERLGVEAAYSFDSAGFGRHRLSASSFFVDTSVLSRSAITQRGRTRVEEGGPGNTEALESFTVALDGGDFPETMLGAVFPGQSPVKGLAYHLGFVSQAAGDGDSARENGFVASVEHKIPLGMAVSLEPVVEYAHFFDANGVEGQDRFYASAGATAVFREQWNLALSYTRRETMPSGSADIGDNLVQVSAGYVFDSGIGVDLGWRYTEDDSIDSQTVGFLLNYCLNCPEE